MKMENVSVVVPVYNAEKYLKKCFKTLQEQTYPNLELLFVNDGSTDGSGELLEEFVKEHKNARLITHTENQGTFISRFEAFSVSTGNFVTFSDADDVLDKDYVEKSLKEIKRLDSDLLINDFLEFSENVKQNRVYASRLAERRKKTFVSEENCFDDFMTNLVFNRANILWVKMIKSSVVKKSLDDAKNFIPYAKGISCGEDYLFSSLFAYHSRKIVNFHGPIYYYRMHNSQSVNYDSKEKLLWQTDNFLRSMKMIKDFLTEKGTCENYVETLKKLIEKNCGSWRVKAIKFKCIKEFDEMVKNSILSE